MHVSNCHFLFGQEADQVFPAQYLQKAPSIDKRQFVERCLELAMRVHVYLFTHKSAILLLDPRAFNKQCQLYALRACQIHRTYHQKTDEEKRAGTEENRFLHLAFFLNYQFRERETYVKTILSALRRMDLTPFSSKSDLKLFIKFLRDEDGSREKASRIAFNQIFESYTKGALDRLKETDSFSQELSLLSHENLRAEGTSLGVKCEALYTYPKLAGLAFLMDAVARENLQFVLKVKVVNQKGCGGVVRYASGPIGENDPVIVFAGFATDGSCSVLKSMEEAKKCPSYLYRNSYSEKGHRHSLNEKCFYCTPIDMDLRPQQERLNQVMASAKDLLFALGAEFMTQEQRPFIAFFKNPDKYPRLAELFQNSLSKIGELELMTNQTRSLAIYHTYTEIGERANSDAFALDASPEQFLISNGLIGSLKEKDAIPMKPSRLESFCTDKFNAVCAARQLTRLSRAQRIEVIAQYEQSLNQQGFCIKNRKDRIPKEKDKK